MRAAIGFVCGSTTEGEKVLDFERWLEGPVFEPLRDLTFFRRFFVEGGTVAWPNGADIAPETLYDAEPAHLPAEP